MKNAFAKGVLALSLCMSMAAMAGTPEPMRTTRAAVGNEIKARLGYEYFNDVELDEAENFDGWTTTAELAVPFLERFQLRLTYPFRTDGDAKVKMNQPNDPGKKITIKGNGGVYDFLTLDFEHQLFSVADKGYDFTYYVGVGVKAGRLHTTKWNPEDGRYDPFNHTGNVFQAGVKFDRVHSFGEVVLNGGFRYYWNSDDIYPGGNKGSFPVADLRGAVIFSPWGSVIPVVEATYLGDFSDFNQTTLLPELLWPVSSHVDLKGGAVIGLGGTGNQFGGQAEVAVHF